MGDWCTIESDPGVFTELMEKLGVQDVEVDELWSLDDGSLANLMDLPVYGLIFLFKWQQQPQQPSSSSRNSDTNNDMDAPTNGTPLTGEDAPVDLFFAHQVTTNACATQAILSILMNQQQQQSSKSTFQLGPYLTEFKSFTSSFPPDILGEAIGASDEIRTAHNAYARKDAFFEEGKPKRVATADDDVFHFIAYVPKNGIVYELDGLQQGPIVVGQYENDHPASSSSSSNNNNDNNNNNCWLKVARTAIQKRMDLYASTEIKFNLMAVTQDRRVPIRAALQLHPNSVDLQADLQHQQAKRQAWKVENERRQHNYLPFCVELMKGLAATGNLPTLTKQARERVALQRVKQEQRQLNN